MMYSVSKFESVATTLEAVVARLKAERTKMPKMIIYGKPFGMCDDIYIFFKAELGDNMTEPTHPPNLAKFRLVDVFTSATDQHQKDGIINAFTKDSQQRIVIATVAYRMGIDYLDVRQINLPDNAEQVQLHPYRLKTGQMLKERTHRN